MLVLPSIYITDLMLWKQATYMSECQCWCWVNTDSCGCLCLCVCMCMTQENVPFPAPGLTAVRSLHARTSWPATTALTRARRSSAAHCVTSASCGVTTWWSTPAATPTSSRPCWRGSRVAPAEHQVEATHGQAPSATTAAQMPPVPPSAPLSALPSAQPTRLKPGRTFCPPPLGLQATSCFFKYKSSSFFSVEK